MTHIERALSAEDIIQKLGVELSKISLTCIMAVYNPDRRLFQVNYTSLEPKFLELIQKPSG
jgi:hypothetical protein